MEREPNVHQVKPIQKLFIAQRGEIAYRAARTCVERGIPAVVPYTFSDANPLASTVAEANFDKGWGLSALGGTSADENFTNTQAILDEVKLHGCDAIFLGYGFLAERDDFIKMCEDEGIRVLAPPSEVMAKTGNKISAREEAKKVRYSGFHTIPVLEGTGNLETTEQVHTNAEKLGFPVMLKDPDLGGGSGNVVVKNEQDLEAAYRTLRDRPENQQVFMERYIEKAVHVEIQIVADAYGNVVSLGDRDCTMQRRSQKLIEESPSPHISDKVRDDIQKAAVAFAKAIKYQGVGTWEFIVDLDRTDKEGNPTWYFMEVNPRIQVEHPVTEQQTGKDIVGLMIDIAEGRDLPFKQSDIKPQGHTIEARVYAENPYTNFTPDSGEVSVFKFPKAEGLRVEPALREGDELSPWFDHTLLKLIAHGEDREQARGILIRALSNTEVIGVSSNIAFQAELLATSEFRNAMATTTFVEKWWNKRLADRVNDIEEFLAGGTFNPEPVGEQFNPNLFPQTSTVVRRRDEKEVTFQDHIQRLTRDKGGISAVEYGIQERDGVQWVLFKHDFSINAGALDPEAGNRFVAACKLANEKGLDLVTLISTGGADQWTNSLALHQMPRAVAALKRYPPKSHISVYHGPAYGGVPASYGDIADVVIMVDSKDSKKGFSGIYLVARSGGVNIPENTKAADVYKTLEDTDEQYKGVHSALQHLSDRTVDYVATDLRDASDKITHLVHATATPEVVTNTARSYEPRENIGLVQGSSETSRLDQPGIYRSVWFSPLGRLRDRMIGRRSRNSRNKGKVNEQLTNYQKWKLVHEPTRPTAADLLDTRLGLFDDSVLLTGPTLHFGNDEYYQSLIAAVARIEDKHMLVLAHQTQLVTDELTGKLTKKYTAQGPADYEAAERFVLGVGRKNRLPLITLTDATGGDCSPEAESRAQSRRIGSLMGVRFDHPFPTLSFISGFDFSGGGKTLESTADGAAAAEHSLTFVADPRTKSWIQGGHWFDSESEAFQKYINGESTARAEVLRSMGLIDVVIPEGPGGAHRNRQEFAKNIRAWLLPTLRENMLLTETQRMDRRWARSEYPNQLFST